MFKEWSWTIFLLYSFVSMCFVSVYSLIDFVVWGLSIYTWSWLVNFLVPRWGLTSLIFFVIVYLGFFLGSRKRKAVKLEVSNE